jgi:hypothetical protein
MGIEFPRFRPRFTSPLYRSPLYRILPSLGSGGQGPTAGMPSLFRLTARFPPIGLPLQDRPITLKIKHLWPIKAAAGPGARAHLIFEVLDGK